MTNIDDSIFCINRRQKNKGHGIELLHFLGDGLYQTNEI
jgi:predicted ribosome-associated RNA-binding protein Tma20